MLGKLKSQASPAMVIAMLALVIALGGSAIAATNALTGKQKKESGTIASKVFNKRIGGATVSHAQSADTATRAGTANKATEATSAATATSANTAKSAATATRADEATKAKTATDAELAADPAEATSSRGRAAVVAYLGYEGRELGARC